MIATKVEVNGDAVVVHNFCVHCKTEGMYQITLDQWIAWQEEGRYIQDVFPDKTPDEREFMINGTHAKCFEEMFGPSELAKLAWFDRMEGKLQHD